MSHARPLAAPSTAGPDRALTTATHLLCCPEPPLSQLLQLVAGPGQVAHKVAVEAGLHRSVTSNPFPMWCATFVTSMTTLCQQQGAVSTDRTAITSEEGRILDVFRVQTTEGGQEGRILDVFRVQTAEGGQRQHPPNQSTLRDGESPDARLVSMKELALAEAAALLERRMTKMEQVIAIRRAASSGTTAPDVHADSVDKVASSACGSGYEILFQGFNWDSHATRYYKQLTAQIPELAAAGFTAVWMPPPSDAVGPQGYLPRDLYNLDSAYGTESELRDLISVMKEHGVKAIADIVINHRCAEKQGPRGHWNQFGGRLAWDATAVCSDNPSFGGKGNRKSGDDYVAAPNIDHSQAFVRRDITEWLQWLKDSIGFDGWRYDFVRGYQGSFTKIYNEETAPEMSFGEFWDCCNYTDGVLDYNQDSHRQQTIDWCDSTGGTSAAFDFTTKGILQEAVGRQEYWRLVDANGRPPGVLGMWASRAITFVDNHDTGSTLQHWPFPADNLPEGYAYILTHPGTPTVFYDHFWEEKNGLSRAVKELVQLRKKHGIHCRSQVVIKKAVNNVYVAIIDDKLAGHNYAVWETNK
ncbi:MAG: hypothetical protein WDW38_010440 [Sanguina aurantia]